MYLNLRVKPVHITYQLIFRLNDIENSLVTRATANIIFKPRICTNSFAYNATCEWNECHYITTINIKS